MYFALTIQLYFVCAHVHTYTLQNITSEKAAERGPRISSEPPAFISCGVWQGDTLLSPNIHNLMLIGRTDSGVRGKYGGHWAYFISSAAFLF